MKLQKGNVVVPHVLVSVAVIVLVSQFVLIVNNCH